MEKSSFYAGVRGLAIRPVITPMSVFNVAEILASIAGVLGSYVDGSGLPPVDLFVSAANFGRSYRRLNMHLTVYRLDSCKG